MDGTDPAPDNPLMALARFGGEPACPAGPPGSPLADEAVRAALDAAYQSGDWGRYHGSNCRRLVAALTEQHRVEHVTLCCSGTLAVELALRGLGLGPGDEVLLAGYDFPGNFRAIEQLGAMPVLVDVDAESWNLDPAAVEQAVSSHSRAVIASHLHGGAVPMRQLMEVARRHGLVVIEDACQATGASIEGRRAGTWGDVGVLSFGGSKLLTAGRGGALLTRRADVQQRVKIYCERGNNAFPLSELQAAVLLPQLERLDERNALRLQNAQQLVAELAGTPGLRAFACTLPQTRPGYYKLGFQFQAAELGGWSRDELAACVRAEGVALDPGFRGFARRGGRRCRRAGPLPQASLAGAGALVLHHPLLLEDQHNRRLAAVAIRKACTLLASNPPAPPA